MFRILKLIFWILVILAAAYFALGYSDYQINWDYFKESKEACQRRVKECSESLIRKGIDNVECDFVCVDRNIIIKKK